MNCNGQQPGEAVAGEATLHVVVALGLSISNNNDRPVIPDLEPPTGPPCPAFLQTGNTPERNDPLWTTGVAGAEMVPEHDVQYVYSSFEALPHVTSVLYGAYSASAPAFARCVPESAFAYYAAGFVHCTSRRAILSFFLLRKSYSKHSRMVWSGSYPCLAVYASKVLSDLDPGEYARHWDFPQEIVPEAPGGEGASLSLLGYSYRSRLSRSQRQFLEGCKVFADEPFESANLSFCLNLNLLYAVQNELDAASGMKTSPLPTLLLGSQAQLGRVYFEDELTAVANKAAVFKCAYKLPAEISFAATAFCYRVAHDTDQLNEMLVDPPWVGWRFRVGQRENTIYEYAIRANQWRDYEPSFLNLQPSLLLLTSWRRDYKHLSGLYQGNAIIGPKHDAKLLDLRIEPC